MEQADNNDLLGVGAQFGPNQYRTAMDMGVESHQIWYVWKRYISTG